MLYNNARTSCVGSYGASDTSIVVNTGEGALFPTAFPFEATWEHFESGVVIKREIITVTNIVGDLLTITRTAATCVQDDSANPKVRTNNAYSFSDGDFISQYVTEEDYNSLHTFKNITVPTTYTTKEETKKSNLVYNASSTGNDDYNITITDLTSYADGSTYRFKADVDNTGVATFEVNSLGAIDLKKNQGQDDLITGDIMAGGIVTATYNSTLSCFQFVGQEATVVAGEVAKTTSEFIAGENLGIGDAVYLESDGFVYKTDATDPNKLNFIGFATATVTATNLISVNTSGVDSSQSSLTILSDYYLHRVQVGFDLTTPVSQGTKDLGAFTASYGFAISGDGTKVFVCDYVGDRVYQYPLSTAYDITSAGASTGSIAVGDTLPMGIFISTDGTELYIAAESADTIRQYTMSTAWDITSATFTQSLSAGDTKPYGVGFSANGLKMYIGAANANTIREYTLSVAWDISSATFAQAKSVVTQTGSPASTYLNSDGTKIFLSGLGSTSVWEYTMSTPYDISTATLSDTYVTGQSGAGMTFSQDGVRLYKMVETTEIVGQYDTFGTSSTPGEITDNPYETFVKVGEAVSATQIDIKENKDNLNGVSSSTATAGAVVLGDAQGYITIKVNGEEKKLPYFGT